MLETLQENPGYEPDKKHDLYLIGGNAASTGPGDLLDNILDALPTLFPDSPLKGVRIKLKAEDYYIAVAIEIDGDSFFYCDYPISITS